MSAIHVGRRLVGCSSRACFPVSIFLRRKYATKSTQGSSSATSGASTPSVTPVTPIPKSSCPANTVMTGLAYNKDQPPVLAMEDEEYPGWLWTILSPKVIPEGEAGTRPEDRKRRKEKIKAQNFMKTQ